MILEGLTRNVHTTASDARSPRQWQSLYSQTKRSFFNTLEDPQTSLYLTDQNRESQPDQKTELDPRELYKVKKQFTNSTRGGSLSLGRHDIYMSKNQHQYSFFTNRKPTTSVFGSGRANRRNNAGSRLNTVKVNPINKEPPYKRIIEDSRESTPDDNSKVMLSHRKIATSQNPKLNHTLMSFKSRKDTGQKQQLPRVNVPQTAATANDHSRINQDSYDFSQTNNFRRSIGEQQSEERNLNGFSRAGKRREAATMRTLDPLKRVSQFPDSQGEQNVTPDDPASLTSTPQMQKRNPKSNVMNMTQRNFPGVKLDNVERSPINYDVIPKTSVQRTRNHISTISTNVQPQSPGFGRNNNMPMTQSNQYAKESKDQSRTASPKRHTSEMRKQYNKANTIEDMMLIKEPFSLAHEPQHIKLSVDPFAKQKTQVLISPLKQKSIELDRQDSEMMPGISEIDSNMHPSAKQSIDLKIRKQNDSYGTDPPRIKEDADDFEAQLAAISKTMKPMKMEVNMVPVAIATKSGHNKKMSRKASSRLPLQNSSSFISHNANVKIAGGKERKQVKKLQSFNDDLREVVDMKKYKNDKHKNSQFEGSAQNRERNRSAMQNFPELEMEEGTFNETPRKSQLEKNGRPLVSQPLQKNEKRGSEKNMGECFVASKETLNPPEDDNINQMASVETFQQKMQVNKPPRLEIKTKARDTGNHTPTKDSNGKMELNTPTQIRAYKSGMRGGQLKHSTLTLTMSQLDKTGEPQNATPERNMKKKTSPSPNRNHLVFEQEQEIQPLIIQTHNLAERNQEKIQRKYGETQQQFLNRKLLLEDKIVKQDALLIDCNQLLSDKSRNKKNGSRNANIDLKQQNTSNTEHIDKEASSNIIVKKGTLPTQNSSEIGPSNVKTTINLKQAKPNISYPLQNPLITNQIQTKKIKQVKEQKPSEVIQKIQVTQSSVEPNQDISEVNGKDTGIGVGSVVLHLRKNRQISNFNESLGSQDDEYLTSAILQSDGEEVEMRSLGTRQLGSRNASRGHSSDNGASPRDKKRGDRGFSPGRQKNSRLYSQPQAVMKNGKVLRQKPFTNLVKTGKLANKSGKPLVQQNTRQQKSNQPATKQKRKFQQMDMLELVGNKKEQVMQLPRLPKYDANCKQRRVFRGGSYPPPRASFVIPHYNYYQQHPYGNQQISTDTFGDTIQIAQSGPQMHQLLTLENGQMMIRRIDVAFTPNNQINIRLDPNQVQQQTPQIITNTQYGSNFVMDASNDYIYSPDGRIRTQGNNESSNMRTPSITGTPNTAYKQNRQQFQWTTGQITLHQKDQDQISHGIETICGTEKSVDSLAKHEKRMHHNTLEIDVPNSRNEPMRELREGYTEQARPRRNVTQKINSMVSEMNKSGEILMREHGTANTLLASPEYVNSQPIHSDNQPQMQVAVTSFNTQANLGQTQGQLLDHDGQGVPYGYLLANNGGKIYEENQRLLTTDERVSENDDSAMEISKVGLNDGHETQLSPVSLESPTHPRLNNKDSTLSNANEGVLQIQLHQADSSVNNTHSSKDGTPIARKLVFNKQPTNQKIEPIIHQNQQDLAMTLMQKSHQSQQSDDINQNLQDAKLDQSIDFASMVNGQPSQSDMQKHKELRNSQSKSSKEGENKDDIVRPPKKPKYMQTRSPKVDGHNTEFKPWDDKPDACLAQQDKVGSRKNMLSKVNQSYDSNHNKSSTLDRKNIVSKIRAGSLAGSKTSSDGQNSNRNKGQNKMGKKQPSVDTRRSIENKVPASITQRYTKYGNKIVVQDKAQISQRKEQEQDMQEIVFDDSNTPTFRIRGDMNEDKTLDEFVKKPLDAMLDDIITESPVGEIVDVSDKRHSSLNQNYQDDRNEPEMIINRNMSDHLENNQSPNQSARVHQAREFNQSSIRSQLTNPVLSVRGSDLKALKSKDLKFQKAPQEPPLIIQRAAAESAIESQDNTSKVAKSNESCQFVEEIEHYDQLMKKSIGWKPVVPEGEECIGYITENRMDSYFQ